MGAPSRLHLAPMAGLTTPGVRALCLELGAASASTGLVDAEGLVRGSAGSLRRAALEGPGEKQTLQLFGTDPGLIREAAAMAAELGYGGAELNLGCPAGPLARRGCGAAQMADPQLDAQIAALREGAARCGVKARSGLEPGDGLHVRVWERACAAGVDWFCLHPRTLGQGYGGRADWSRLDDLPERPGEPALFAVGDVGDAAEGARRLAERPRLAGVQVGRAAILAPWIFLETEPPLEERAALLAELLRRLASESTLEEGGRLLAVLSDLLGLGHGEAAQTRLADRRRAAETRERLALRLSRGPAPRLEGNPFLRR